MGATSQLFIGKGYYSPATDDKGDKLSIVQDIFKEVSYWENISSRDEPLIPKMVKFKNKLAASVYSVIMAEAVADWCIVGI